MKFIFNRKDKRKRKEFISCLQLVLFHPLLLNQFFLPHKINVVHMHSQTLMYLKNTIYYNR